jgi:large subunit ribosomal protein L24
MKQPSSHKPGKQRKWRQDAPLHRRRKMVGSTLSRELRGKYNRRNIPIRRGDKVKIMRGEFRGVEGEVTRVDLKNYKIYLEGVNIKKSDGTDVERVVDPSNVMIMDVYMEDKQRRDVLERKVK